MIPYSIPSGYFNYSQAQIKSAIRKHCDGIQNHHRAIKQLQEVCNHSDLKSDINGTIICKDCQKLINR